MTLSIGMITTDSTDPLPLAQWWAAALDGRIVADHEGWFVVIDTPSGTMAFQKVPAVTPGKNRIHVDFTVPDRLEAATDALLAAGAQLVARRSEGEDSWNTLADPQGNEFCVALGGSSTWP